MTFASNTIEGSQFWHKGTVQSKKKKKKKKTFQEKVQGIWVQILLPKSRWWSFQKRKDQYCLEVIKNDIEVTNNYHFFIY